MVVIVMGVTGCGKTTVGRRLSSDLEWPFHDADDFHPPENVEKMSRGIPLTDEDRRPWLEAIRRKIDETDTSGRHAVIGCSALKESYRHVLRDGAPAVSFAWLTGPRALLAERLRHRVGHFMNPALLDSQLQTLEEPAYAVRVEIALPLAAQVRLIRSSLNI